MDEYVLSLSYGKDSLACIYVIKEILHLPLTRIVHAEVWATDDIPADLPPMVEFKSKADKIIKERWGLDVDHVCAMKKEGHCYGVFGQPCEGGEKLSYDTLFRTRLKSGKYAGTIKGFPKNIGSWCKRLKFNSTAEADLREYLLQTYSKIPFKDCSSRERERDGQTSGVCTALSNSSGRVYGFPISRGNWCNSDLKMSALRISEKIQGELVQQRPQNVSSTDFREGTRGIGATGDSKPPLDGRKDDARDINVIQYIGIAADEPLRIAKHKDRKNVVMPLVEAGWTEAMCRKWCEENDLLSPTYTTATRGGCWFCHNQGVDQLRQLRHNYPDLWAILLRWDNDSPVTFHADGHTVHDFDRRFQLEDDGLITKDDKFHWDFLDGDIPLKIKF